MSKFIRNPINRDIGYSCYHLVNSLMDFDEEIWPQFFTYRVIVVGT